MLKYALLGLLRERARHGYDLKVAFELLTGGTWPLNIGQVYTTLARLERDGLVASEVHPQDDRPDRRVFTLTKTGAKELTRWLGEPVEGPVRLKDELFVKILVHRIASGGEGLAELLWAQRQRYLEHLAQLTDRQTDPTVAAATRLLLEGAILHAEADLRWLDRIEEELNGRHR